jgi:hypothetical protein
MQRGDFNWLGALLFIGYAIYQIFSSLNKQEVPPPRKPSAPSRPPQPEGETPQGFQDLLDALREKSAPAPPPIPARVPPPPPLPAPHYETFEETASEEGEPGDLLKELEAPTYEPETARMHSITSVEADSFAATADASLPAHTIERANRTVSSKTTVGILARLKTPASLREAILINEILAKPRGLSPL